MTHFRTCCLSVLCDGVAIAFLVVALIIVQVLENNGYVTKRGFYCEDASIRFPYGRSTVPTWLLLLTCIGIPITTLIGGSIYERLFYLKPTTSSSLKVGFLRSIPPWIIQLGFHVCWFAIGFMCNVVATTVLKMAAGRLRPHFVVVCMPNFSSFNCSDEYGYPLYVTDYECLGTDHKQLIESRLSWPSGHASTSAYAMMFVCFYIASVPSFYPRSGVKLVLMLVPVLLALLTASSRITDHKHHPFDVISGFVLGSLICLVVVFYNLQFFGHFKKKQLSDQTEEVNSATEDLV